MIKLVLQLICIRNSQVYNMTTKLNKYYFYHHHYQSFQTSTEAEEKRSIEDSREPVENVRLTNEKEAKRVAELEARRAAEEEATRAAEEEAMRATEEEAMRAAEEEATRAAEEEAMRAAEEEAMRAAEELEKRIADEERKRATEAARREKEMELRAILIEVMNTQNREAILEAIKEARGAYMTGCFVTHFIFVV